MQFLKDDPLVPAADYGFIIEPMYFKWGISEDSDCFIRPTVAEKLERARGALPLDFNFKIWDGYRKTIVQRRLYESLYKKLEQSHPDWSIEQLHAGVCEFVSPPTTDPLKAAPHNTGGTVDLTIVDAQGHELPMGTPFDHFEVEAHTFHFEGTPPDDKNALFHQNRMLLYNVLSQEKFYNYPEEWWHFSYGDATWAEYYGEEIIYASCEFEGA